MTIASRIVDIASYLPERVETNDDLQRQNPEWMMEKLSEKSGILARHIAAPNQTAGDMAREAGAKLLSKAPNRAKDVDYLLYCTQSPDYYLPSTACQLQAELGLEKHVGALDFNLGCSGYVYGLQLANSLIAGGAARNVLLITSDTYSKYVHPKDRTVRTLFGDAAAATLISEGVEQQRGIGQFVVGTNGRGAKNLVVPAGGLRQPRSQETAIESTDDNDCTRSADNLYMDGKAIFTFAISAVPSVVRKLLKKTDTTVEDYDWFVFHQANQFMLEHLRQRCKIPEDKMVLAYQDVGNTVSSSIPLALEQYVADGRIQPGHRLMLIGFGVGYSWAAGTMQWS